MTPAEFPPLAAEVPGLPPLLGALVSRPGLAEVEEGLVETSLPVPHFLLQRAQVLERPRWAPLTLFAPLAVLPAQTADLPAQPWLMGVLPTAAVLPAQPWLAVKRSIDGGTKSAGARSSASIATLGDRRGCRSVRRTAGCEAEPPSEVALASGAAGAAFASGAAGVARTSWACCACCARWRANCPLSILLAVASSDRCPHLLRGFWSPRPLSPLRLVVVVEAEAADCCGGGPCGSAGLL